MELSDFPDQLLKRQLECILAPIDYRHRWSLERVTEWAKRDRQRKEAEIRRLEDELQRKEGLGRESTTPSIVLGSRELATCRTDPRLCCCPRQGVGKRYSATGRVCHLARMGSDGCR
jgi:hypothetical protein